MHVQLSIYNIKCPLLDKSTLFSRGDVVVYFVC